MDITKLPVGAEIAVPRKEFMTGKEKGICNSEIKIPVS
jgi:hypothetical protein